MMILPKNSYFLLIVVFCTFAPIVLSVTDICNGLPDPAVKTITIGSGPTDRTLVKNQSVSFIHFSLRNTADSSSKSISQQ